MNQNNPNEINNFDPITGQAIQKNSEMSKHTLINRKKTVIIILIIVAVVVSIIIFSNKQSKNANSQEANEIIPENQNNSIDSNTINSETNLNYDEDGPFLFSIEDVFTVTNRGTIVTGRVLRGKINLDDKVQIIGLNHKIIDTTVTGIEIYGKNLNSATAGESVGLVLKGVPREEVERGQVVSLPNSIVAVQKFDAEIYMLKKEEGGIKTPIVTSYSPQFYFREIDINGTIILPTNIEKISPGDTAMVNIELKLNVAMEVGTEFSIREGIRTIAKGKVIKIY